MLLECCLKLTLLNEVKWKCLTYNIFTGQWFQCPMSMLVQIQYNIYLLLWCCLRLSLVPFLLLFYNCCWVLSWVPFFILITWPPTNQRSLTEHHHVSNDCFIIIVDAVISLCCAPLSLRSTIIVKFCSIHQLSLFHSFIAYVNKFTALLYQLPLSKCSFASKCF